MYAFHGAHGAVWLASCAMVQMRCVNAFGVGLELGTWRCFGTRGSKFPFGRIGRIFYVKAKLWATSGASVARCMRLGVRTEERVRTGAIFPGSRSSREKSWLSGIHPSRTSQVSGQTSESKREICVQKNRSCRYINAQLYQRLLENAPKHAGSRRRWISSGRVFLRNTI